MVVHGVEPQREVKPFSPGLRNERNPCYAGLQAEAHQSSNDLRSDSTLPVFRKDYKILDIPVRNSIRNDPTHTNSAVGFIFHRDCKSVTPPHEVPEIFCPVLLLPPPRLPVKGSYLILVP